MIKKFVEKKVDFLCNTQPMTYPDGQDIEIFFSNIKKTYQNAEV